jgi:hypothetical protein
LAQWEAECALASELEQTPAGPALAARIVELVGHADCSASTVVELIAGLGRSIAALEGVRAHLVWGAVEPHGGDTLEIRSTIEEIALRIGHTYGTVRRMVELGMGMAAVPDLGRAVCDGRIGAAKATQILRDTEHLDPDRREHVISDVISRDPETRNLRDLRRLTRMLAEWVDPLSAADLHARARAKRSVWIDKARHGMAFLHAYLPAIDAHQVYATLTTMALAEDPDLPATLTTSPPDTRGGGTVADGGTFGPRRDADDGGITPNGDGTVWGGDGVLSGRDGQVDCGESPPDIDEPVGDGEVPPEIDRDDDGVDVPWVDYAREGDIAEARAAQVTRTLGNRRADALTDLFSPTGPFATGRPFDAVRPRLVVVARAEALLGSDHFPGELIGYGSLPAHAVRRIAQDATWSAIYCDPHTGRVVAAGTRILPPGLTASADPPATVSAASPPGVDPPDERPRDTSPLADDVTPVSQPDAGADPPPACGADLAPPCSDPGAHLGVAGAAPPGPAWLFPPEAWPAETMACHSYRPSPHLRTTLALRDQSCRFPGCGRPAWACDLDHRVPFDPGRPAIDQTIASNLQPLCRPHHRLKTLAGWDWTRDIRTGILTITSPQGRIYRVEPPTPTSPPWEPATW